MRTTHILAILGAALAAAGAGSAALWLNRSGPQRTDGSDAAEEARSAEMRALEARIRGLEESVDGLIREMRMAESPAKERVPVLDERLDARVSALEKALADPKQAPIPEPEPVADADTLIAKLDANKAKFAATNVEARKQRIAMLMEFLERFPDHPRAADRLEQLIAEQLAWDGKATVAALERFRDRVKMDWWRFDAQYANALEYTGRREEAHRIYTDLVNRSDAPQNARKNAQFWLAYSQMQHGELDAAEAGFRRLIADCEALALPDLANLAAGAKNQLVEIERRRQH